MKKQNKYQDVKTMEDLEVALHRTREKIASQGEEVHGGVPICWPWLGGRAGYPSHGIVRYIPWHPEDANGHAPRSSLSFLDTSTPATLAQWPHDFRLCADIAMPSPDSLEITLTETNTGDQPFDSGFGFHPYFAISDAPQATLDGVSVPPQDGSTLKFPANGSSHVLGDPARGIEIAVLCDDADYWYLWNPGPDKPYVAPGEWRRFFCLEPLQRTLAPLGPGETRKHTVLFRVRRTDHP